MAGLAAVICALAATGTASANPYTPPPGETIVADSGFRPQTSGYSFENYTNDINPTNLTAEEMRFLFGPTVCAERQASGPCTLVASAKQWMLTQNKGMAGGHCEGMAVTSEFFHYGVGDPPSPQFFGAPTTPGLQLQNNPNLQRQIAFGFIWQELNAVKASKLVATPNQVLGATIDALNNGVPVATGFYKSDKTGGHAVTPAYVADRGGGVFDLVIYDNNFPNQLRTIVVDTNANSWDYLGGTDPSNTNERYVGNAQTGTLELEYLVPGLQQCFFCTKPAPRKAARGAVDAENWLENVTEAAAPQVVGWEGDPEDGRHGNLEITDSSGNKAGCRMDENGQMICENSIPGAVVDHPKLGGGAGVPVFNQSPQPTYNLPAGDFKVELKGGDVQGSPNEGVSVVRDGVTFAVDGVELKDGEKQIVKIENDELVFNNEKGESEGTKFQFGFEGETDYSFRLNARGLAEDASLAIDLNENKETLDLKTAKDKGNYSLEVTRTSGTETEELSDKKIKSKQGKELTLDFGKWDEDDKNAPLDR
jgi:hypothetical protein